MDDYPKERTIFENGSFVLAEHRHNSLRRGPKSKLLPFLRGPFLVKSHNTSSGMYVLQDLVTQKLTEYHNTRLRKFEYDERTLTPLQVAVTDFPDEFIVEECLNMRGDTREKTKLEFNIRWAGYGPEDDTWEPWEYVRDSEAVQTYLFKHPHPRVRKLAKKGYLPPSERNVEYSSSDDEDVMDTY